MDDYALERSRLLAGTTGLHAYSMEAALQPQLRPTFPEIGRSSIGTAVVDPTYQSRYFQGPLSLGGGTSLPFLGSMFTSSLLPSSQYRAPAGGGIVNMRQFWPPTPPPDAYSRCTMNGSLYPLYSSMSSLTPSSDSTSPYTSQSIMSHLTPSTPFTHLLETHKESPFLSPSLSLSSPLPPTHHLSYSAPYLPVPPSPILDRHPVYGGVTTLGLKRLDDPPTPVPEQLLETNNRIHKRELHSEQKSFSKSEESRKRTRDGVKVAAVKGREKMEEIKPVPVRDEAKRILENPPSSSIPAVITATVSPSVVHGSQRTKASRPTPIENGVSAVKESPYLHLKEDCVKPRCNTMPVHPVVTTVIATSTGTTTSVTYSNSPIDTTFKPLVSCTPITVPTTCQNACISNAVISNSDSPKTEVQPSKLAGKEEGQSIATYSTWVHHQTSITTVTNTRKTCYTSEKSECCTLTKQFVPETEDSDPLVAEAVNLSVEKIKPLVKSPKKDVSPQNKRERRSHEKKREKLAGIQEKLKISSEKSVADHNAIVTLSKEEPLTGDQDFHPLNVPQAVFKSAIISQKAENTIYSESWPHRTLGLKDEHGKRPKCEFPKDSKPRSVDGKQNLQNQAMNLSVGNKPVKTEKPETHSSGEVTPSSRMYLDGFSEPGVESVSSSHSLSALSRLASSASSEIFSPAEVSAPWASKNSKPSSMVSSVQSETMRLAQSSKSPVPPPSNTSLVVCAGSSPELPSDKAKTSFDCGKSIELKRKSLCSAGNTVLAVHETSSTVLSLTSSVGCASAHSSIPVGIAVAQQRQEPINFKRGNTSEIEHFPVTCQPQTSSDPSKNVASSIQAELKVTVSQPSATNILVNQGASISATQWDSDAIIRAPLQNSWLAQAPVVAPTVWLGQGTYTTPAPAPTQTVSSIPLEPSSHLPLPPVGYQLARDPLSGHIFLIPATNLERSSLWSTFAPGTVQQLVTSAPHHFQPSFQHHSATIKQEPCAIVTHVKEKLDHLVTNSAEIIEPKQEVKEVKPIATAVAPSVASIAVQSGQPFTFSGFTTTGAPTLSYYYEPPTIVHLTQPTAAAIQTEPGKRSQGTSPLNPVSPSPPPESLDQEDMDSGCLGKGEVAHAITTTMAIQVDLDACNTSDDNDFEERTIEVLDSANQTDAVLSDATKEESEDESPPLLKEEEIVISEVEPKITSFDNILEIPEDSAPVMPTESKPVMDFIDHHGLDLLVDSIEEFASREQVKEECKEDLSQDVAKSEDKPYIRSDDCDIKKAFDPPVSDVRTECKPAAAINKETTDSYACNLDPTCTDGLGLLCALAEQRFLEESQKSECKSSVEKSNPDVNQNYQSSKKEVVRQVPKVHPLPKLPVVQPLSAVLPVAPICMDPAELEMRERLADLQRKYKQKQKELARLKPKKEKEDTTTCNPKKSPGRPRKHHFSLFSSSFGKNFANMLQMSKMSDSQERDGFDEIPKKKKKLYHSNSVTCNKPKLQKKKSSHSLKCHVLTTKQKVEKAVLSANAENGFGAYNNNNNNTFVQQHFLESKEKKHFDTHEDDIENTHVTSDIPNMEKKTLPETSSDSDDDKLLIDLWRKSSIEKDGLCRKSKPEETSDVASEKHDTGAIDVHRIDSNGKPHAVCVGALGMLAECASLYTDKNCKRKATEDSDHGDVKSPVSKKLKDSGKDETVELKDDASNEENDSNTKSKKLKTTEKSKKRPSIDDDPWNRRRSERIFLHDAGVTLPPTLAFTSVEDATTLQPKSDSDSNKVELKVSKSSLKSDEYIRSKKKVKSKKDISSKKAKSKEIKKRKDKVVPDELSMALKHCRLSESSAGAGSPVQDDSSSSSEGDVPLIQLVERDRSPELRSCKLKSSDLHDNLRVLTKEDGLYYAGYITAIQAPDIYGITLDGERCNRPRIFSREELLNEAILEVKPATIPQIPIGKRVCAFWSQQYRCLYPGKVAKWKQTATGPTLDKNMVFVEFDDGDSGRIPLEDIRLLPKDIPVQGMEPEPLLLLGKKRQRSASESQTEQKTSSESPVVKIKHKKKSKKPSKSSSSKSDSKSSNKKSSKSSSKKLLKSISKESSNSSKSFDALSVFADSTSCTSFNSACSSEKSNQKKKSKKSKCESKSKKKLREGSCTTDEGSSSGASNKSKKHKKHKSEHKHRHHHHRHHCHHSHHHKKHKHQKRPSPKDGTKRKNVSSKKKVSILDTSSTLPSTKPTNNSETKKSELTVKIKSQLLESKSKEPDVLKLNGIVDSPTEVPIKTASISPVLTNSDKKEDKSTKKPMKRKERTVSAEKSKIAAFLPARQLWGWSGKSFRRPGTKGKAKKEFFKAITRGKETILVGDCAVFLSTGRPHLPYVGRIETMWQSWGGNMVVKVKWFYHPEETKGGKRLTDSKGALYQSPHVDENDVQTISHKCEVLNYEDYKKWRAETRDNTKYGSLYDNDGVYYLAGTYEPLSGVVTLEAGVS